MEIQLSLYTAEEILETPSRFFFFLSFRMYDTVHVFDFCNRRRKLGRIEIEFRVFKVPAFQWRPWNANL